MFSIKQILFSLFGTYFNEYDTNKDANDKGTLERYNEIIGEDVDDNILPHIRDMVADNLNPEELLVQFLGLRENSLGIEIDFFSTNIWRRRILKYYVKWVQMKGSSDCLRLMFGMLGISMTLTTSNTYYSFDDITFDDPNRVFDLDCNNCVEYELILTGNIPLDADLTNYILGVIEFNEPINADLTFWSYNGSGNLGSFGNSYGNSFN